mgnify:CR=1 FL=1|tara:strand:- start:1572 stop:1880 length:309 start_codon:yes stop_codon:yes gene_type:complete
MPAYEYKVTYADGSTNNIRALESQVEELTKDGGSYEKIEVALTDGQIRNNARSWRDMELLGTDYIVPLTDHPQRDAYMSYRTALRNWPSTDDFPDTKPTLGS